MKRPVFVVGCPRSGTTLLYSLLVAAGGFAFYRKETHFYDLIRRFPELSSAGARVRFAQLYLNGYLGKVPGLDVEPLVRQALEQCQKREDFLPLLMTGIARAQGVDRWVEGTPVHVLYMKDIKRANPDALFVHVIRDGRDCALSNDKQGWIATLPWDRSRRLGVTALHWEWMVRAGRSYGRANPDHYLEVRFEDLIGDPRTTLNRVGAFIDHDLDYDRIQQNPVHAMFQPNTSFRKEWKESAFKPVGRWAEACSEEDIKLCEQLVGSLLKELDYPLTHAPASDGWLRTRLMRAMYLGYFAAKHSLKVNTPLGRFMTRTSIWAAQPRAGERPVRPIPAHAAASSAQSGHELVSH